MNRRNFLVRLGQAATAVAATLTLDPEQLLWVPGKKTIIDLGATKQILPATDAEVFAQARGKIVTSLLESGPRHIGRQELDLNAHDRKLFGLDGPRDIRLDISAPYDIKRDRQGAGMVSFRFKDDKLVSRHTAEELALLNRPFWKGRS